ncbi:MAG: YXWGXW repeat-containing protein [Enhydrobacter sp.]|nr:MAG: YXWGXW repeat-containing protein [Enhydrobacter sp.]
MLKNVAMTSLAAVAIFSAATMATAALTPAAAQVSITFGAPPPAPVYEAVPAPRHGYVWAQGYYRLVNDRYVWVPGRWVEARPGYRYVPDRWDRVYIGGREQWRYVPSRWDRDGDGIPNRYDRRDDRHGWKGDRDRDGIPDRYDRYDNRQSALGDRDDDGIPNIFDSRDNRRW